MFKANEYGRSMIEMLGVLAIIGVLSVGGISGYSKAMKKFKTNKAMEQVSMITSNVQSLFATSRSYEGLNLDVAIATKIIPEDMLVGGDVINAFGGGVEVVASKTDRGEFDGFIVAFFNVPASECVAFGSNNIIGDNLVAFSYGLSSEADGAGGATASGCGQVDFEFSEVTESSDPVNGSCCKFNVPGHSVCGYPMPVSAGASIAFGSNCTVAWKIK